MEVVVRGLKLWFLVALVACKAGEGAVGDPPKNTASEPGKGPIDDAALFDPTHLIDVSIEMDADDFGQIRAESRDGFEVLGGDCTAQPFESPFTWFEGDVTVDGELIERAGVRKKGFLGSMSADKPSLKISTDEWVADQLMADGTERLTLNNNVQDPSVLNQCLGLSVFAAAGVPAPRCNFAEVSVNGEGLGVYTHVEAVKKDFLRRHFEDDDGDLYEGTLSDFAADWTGTFDPKTDTTDPDAAVVSAVTAALDASDAELIGALEPLLDLPAFYRFWAVETRTRTTSSCTWTRRPMSGASCPGGWTSSSAIPRVRRCSSRVGSRSACGPRRPVGTATWTPWRRCSTRPGTRTCCTPRSIGWRRWSVPT